jgi:bifunctional UDP-N-acetylglucosamine pyrophosphorylase/glucosamine-1-phosphate N-acetyltransferase
LVLCADTPFIKSGTIKRLLKVHRGSGANATVLTAVIENPTGYGRVIRVEDNTVEKIVEELDASLSEREVKEVNVGAYCFNAHDLADALRKLKPNNRKKEYYLTDSIDILHGQGKKVEAVTISSYDEMIGINSRADLAHAICIKRMQVLSELMASGVTIEDPSTTWVSPDVKIGSDTVIRAHTVIERDVKIGARCRIGPFSRLRPGVRLGDDVTVGNFAELNRTKVGDHTKIKHMSYLGDAVVGTHVNIGAGFIIANYDGKKKHISYIEHGAFIGVGSILIAPARIGKKAVVGAGCVVTKGFSVPAGATVVGVPARILRKR